MKKHTAFILAAVMLISLCACGKSEGTSDTADVDKNLLTVTITIPESYAAKVTQEELDNSVAKGRSMSATKNDDGSITYVMTRSQHKALLDMISQTIDGQLDRMPESEDYPDITKVEHSADYTQFTVTTRNEEVSISETVSILAFYMYGNMYGAYSGESPDNVSVSFVNEASGEVIDEANSADIEAQGN